jgi:ribosomal protein S18 acetylase RimI-like enzyme
MGISIARVRELREHELRPLLDASESEGFHFLRRVACEWQTGDNRFSQPGEALFGAFDRERLVGICGLMLDPYARASGVARLRNLYVLPEYRRSGIGKQLTQTVIASATGSFHLLRLRAGTPEAASFYDHLGFTRSSTEPDSTHLLSLTHRQSYIRPAQVDDAEGIATVHVLGWQAAYRGVVPDSYLDSLSIEQRALSWRAFFREPSPTEVWAADANQHLIGWVSMGESRDDDAPTGTGELNAIYVLPEYWSSGVGRALWLRAKQRLAERGFRRATLWVLADNDRAVRFYRAAGFSPISERDIEIGGKVLREVRYEVPIG